MRLPELQQRFVHASLFAQDSALLENINSDRISAADRMAAYKNNVYVGLFEALKNTFPTIIKLVSEDFFRGVVHFYVKEQPPTNANIDEYGSGLAEFLSRYEPAKQLAYLPDIARLDWAMHECAIAENDTPLNPSGLTKLGEAIAEMLFPLRSGVRLVMSDYPLGAIWRFCQEPEKSKPIDLTPLSQCFIIYRTDDYGVWFEPVSHAFSTAFKYLGAGQTLHKAAQSAAHQDADFDLGALLAFAFSRELLKGQPHA